MFDTNFFPLEEIRERNLRKFSIDENLSFAYSAALIDAEGTITIRRNKNRFYPMLIICNTNKEVLEKIKETFEMGSIRIVNYKNKKRKPLFIFSLSRVADVLSVLTVCYPYFIIKKTHATRLISFCRSRLINKRREPTEEEKELYMEIRKLNARGVQSNDFDTKNDTSSILQTI